MEAILFPSGDHEGWPKTVQVPGFLPWAGVPVTGIEIVIQPYECNLTKFKLLNLRKPSPLGFSYIGFAAAGEDKCRKEKGHKDFYRFRVHAVH